MTEIPILAYEVGFVVAFVIMFALLSFLIVALHQNEKTKGYAEALNVVADFAEDLIVTVALSPANLQYAISVTPDYAERLNKPDLDYRMVAVLLRLEEFVEEHIPYDIELVVLYHRAERVYQELRDNL
jgi:hypothetical protein